MTGCAPGCSRSPTSPMCRWSGRCFAEVAQRYPGLDEPRLIHESIRRLIDRMVRDLIGETGSAARRAAAPESADEVRALDAPGRGVFRRDAATTTGRSKRFLLERMYRHYRVNRMSSKARRVVHELFQLFLAEPECLPSEWRAAAGRRRGGAGAHRRRLPRRDDRPICPRRASPLVRYLRGCMTTSR